jgi:thioredoxin reductase (NADPH)
MLDLAIIGGGPAGITAGLYASRGGLKNVAMFENALPGGQITASSEIENYPGVSEVMSGLDFMQNWLPQAQKFGLRHEAKEIDRVAKDGDKFVICTADGDCISAKAVVIATGSIPKKAGFKGEEQYFGRGVSICATCDGFFYRNKEVAIIGGGDTALEEAHFLATFCKKIYLIHRGSGFTVAPSSIKRVMEEEKIEVLFDSSVTEALGDAMGLTGLRIQNKNGDERLLEVPGVFVFVGRDVNNSVLFCPESGKPLCDINPQGEIVVDLRMKTSIPGLFAAGDCRSQPARQVICAAGDGATAAISAIEYLTGVGK